MRTGGIFIPFAMLITSPAIAQVQGNLPNADLQRQVIDFDPGHTVQLQAALGYQLMVELAPDERIKSVALGDGDAWHVDVGKDGDRFFLKPTRAGEPTNMTVVTSVRTYSFDLEAVPERTQEIPYTVAFHYPPSTLEVPDPEYVDVSAAIRRTSEYWISGDQTIRPKSVSDDGRKTYVVWPTSAPIPAVYTVDHSGKEVLLDGMMGTDDVYVVDGVPLRLTFRIDRMVARAERTQSPKNR